jgi:hypothetical protein
MNPSCHFVQATHPGSNATARQFDCKHLDFESSKKPLEILTINIGVDFEIEMVCSFGSTVYIVLDRALLVPIRSRLRPVLGPKQGIELDVSGIVRR